MNEVILWVLTITNLVMMGLNYDLLSKVGKVYQEFSKSLNETVAEMERIMNDERL